MCYIPLFKIFLKKRVFIAIYSGTQNKVRKALGVGVGLEVLEVLGVRQYWEVLEVLGCWGCGSIGRGGIERIGFIGRFGFIGRGSIGGGAVLGESAKLIVVTLSA